MVQLAKLSDYKVEPDLGYKDIFGYYRYFRDSLPKPKLDIFDTLWWLKRNGMLFSLKSESYHEDRKVRKLVYYRRYNKDTRRYNMDTLADISIWIGGGN